MQQSKLPGRIYLLLICVAFFYITQSLLVTISALVGFDLAVDKRWATLPIALLFFSIALITVPASRFMRRYGQTQGFILASVLGIMAAIITSWSLFNNSFIGFCTASLFFGAYIAFSKYYRLITTELISPEFESRIISMLITSGIIAAFIGPNLANWSSGIFNDNSFAGPFVVLIVIYLVNIATVLIARLPASTMPVDKNKQDEKPARNIKEIIKQPLFIIAACCHVLGFAAVMLIVISTPLAMKANALSIGAIAIVIQWYFVATFAPTFFTGRIIKRIGLKKVLFAGVLFGVLCIVVNSFGESKWHFITALILLGLCWNCLQVGGTLIKADSYRENEKANTQVAYDVMVFSTAAITALLAGVLHFQFGWQAINLAAIPFLLIISAAIIWIYRLNTLTANQHSKLQNAELQRDKIRLEARKWEGVQEYAPTGQSPSGDQNLNYAEIASHNENSSLTDKSSSYRSPNQTENLSPNESSVHIHSTSRSQQVRCGFCRGRARIKTDRNWTTCKFCNGRGVRAAN